MNSPGNGRRRPPTVAEIREDGTVLWSWLAGSSRVVVLLVVLSVTFGVAEWITDLAATTNAPVADQRRGRRDHWHAVAWLAWYATVAPPLGWLATTVIHRPASWTAGSAVSQLPFGVRLALALATVEAVAYGLHRAAHRVPWLWRIHEVHHRAVEVRWWTTFRFHPIETVWSMTAPYVVAAALGLGLDVIGATLGFVTVVTLFAHANVWMPDHAWLRIVITPTYHRRHHRPDSDDTNFGLITPLFDVLFGTADFSPRSGPARPTGGKPDQRTSTKPMPNDKALAAPATINPNDQSP